ncbi:MAG: outer rane efflux protein [Firmicutes bacterium]|nr:outer rane efflux protein [Bacillota bacterium]
MKLSQRCRITLISSLVIAALCHPVFAGPIELTLDDSIKLALKNNYDTKIAEANREQYAWAIKQAKANKGAALTYAHTSERYNTPPTIYTPNYTYTNTFDNQLSLTFPVYSGGKLESKIDQAKLDLTVADLDLATAKQQLKLNVVTYYFNVLEYRNEVRNCQETVNNYTEHLNLVNNKYRLGMVAKTDVLSSQVNLADGQDSLIKAQNNYNNAVATLNNALGLPHGSELSLKDDFKYVKNTQTLEECLNYAENHRPEIAQYKAKVASAEADIKIAKSGYRPTVDLTAQQDWNDSHLPGTENSNWLVKLTASFNLFDSGLTDSQIHQADYSLTKVRHQANQKRDSILLDVRQYYLSMYEAEKRIETSKVSVNQASENLMIEKAKYNLGAGTNIDVLDAVLSLDKAKKNYTLALYDYNTAKASLEQAMGIPVK